VEQEWGEEGEPPAGKKKEKKKKTAPKERDPKRAKYTEQGRIPNLSFPLFFHPLSHFRLLQAFSLHARLLFTRRALTRLQNNICTYNPFIGVLYSPDRREMEDDVLQWEACVGLGRDIVVIPCMYTAYFSLSNPLAHFVPLIVCSMHTY
jgi:hypothetical protein